MKKEQEIEQEVTREQKNIEESVLKTILYTLNNDIEHNKIILNNLQKAASELIPSYFYDKHCIALFKTAKAYYFKHGSVPTRNIIQSIITKNNDNDDVNTGIMIALDKIYYNSAVNISHYDFYKNRLIELHNRKNIIRLYANLHDAISKSENDTIVNLATSIANIAYTKPKVDIKLITSTELCKKDISLPSFYVDEMLPNGLTIFAGQKKTGKSALALQLANCIAGGKTFLNKSINRNYKVLYISLEQSEALNKFRIEKQGLGANDNLLFIQEEDINKIKKFDAIGLRIFKDVIVTNDIKVAIIDTWQHVAPSGDKNKNAYENDVDKIKLVKNLADELQIAIILITHKKKTLKDADDWTDDIMGSQGLSATADMIWLLRKTRLKSDAKLMTTSRVARELEIPLLFDQDKLIYKIDEADIQKPHSKIRNDITYILKNSNETLSNQEICDAMTCDYNYTHDKYSYIRSILRHLTNEGIIIRTERGKYKFCHESEDMNDIIANQKEESEDIFQ